jgi:hypothetical protein
VFTVLPRFFLLLLVPLAFAGYQYHDYVRDSEYHGPTPVNDTLIDNCPSLGIDQSVCDATNSTNLTKTAKKALILAALNPDAALPDYGFIDDWNVKIGFGKYPPLGVASISSGSIMDAWVKIVDIWPSVIEGNETLLNDTGKIRARYGFTFVLPDKTAPGDCKTYYSADGYNFSLEITQNGTNISKNNEKDANFALNQSVGIFQANLSIVAGYKASHYVWVTHCSKTSCWQTCDYAYTENVTDNLNLSDSKTGQLYNFSHAAKSIVDGNHSGLLDFWFSYNVSRDFAEIVLESGNSNIRIQGVEYGLKVLYEPYNILTYEAIPKNSTTFSYYAPIIYDNQTENETSIQRTIRTFIPYSDNCTIAFLSHFNRTIIPEFCNVTNQTPILNVSIVERRNDSTVLNVLFYDNSSGQPLPNKRLAVRFDGQEENITTGPSGKAKITLPISAGLVRISFITDLETKSAETIIVLARQPEIDGQTLLGLALLLLALFFAYRIGTRWINAMA